MATKTEKPRYFTKALRCPDGTRKYIRGKTPEELARKVAIAQAELGMGININDNTTVVEFAQMWVDVYKRPKLKPQSLLSVLARLNHHILPVLGAKRVRDVKPADCARVMAGCSHLTINTAKMVRATMKELFECAVENTVIARNPVQKSVSATGREPVRAEPLTPEQVDEMYRRTLDRGLTGLYTFELLCVEAGLRRCEAFGVNLSTSVDTVKGELRVREQFVSRVGGTTTVLKTPAANRVLPMTPRLWAHMVELERAGRTGYIFDVDDPYLEEKYTGRLARMCKFKRDGSWRADGKRTAVLDFYVHPHLLRHTFATRCIQAGMDVKEVQYLMGHSDSSMTLDIYASYQIEYSRATTATKLSAAFPDNKVVAIG